MPIALDPNETAPVALRSDTDKPEAERPVFLFRHLTRKHRRQVDAWTAELYAAESDEVVEGLLDKVILHGLAGWRNMGTDYDPAKLDDILTGAEKMELALVYPREVTRVELSKKKASGSPPSPATAGSAPTAAPPTSA